MRASMLTEELQQRWEKTSRSCGLDTLAGVAALAQISRVDVLKAPSATRARVKSGASD